MKFSQLYQPEPLDTDSWQKVLGNTAPEIDLAKECFGPQLASLKDPARFVTSVCSRRAGKTVGCAWDLLITARDHANVICLYITLARINASRIVWPILKELNQQFQLGAQVNETTLSMRFPNGSVIYCSGAKDQRSIDKFLGLPLKLVYIDEAQSFPSYLGDLIDRVIAPALLDHAGKLKLIGTPGPVQAGTFWELCNAPQWSHHAWTYFDNPWIPIKSGKTHEELLEEELRRSGYKRTDPKIQREFFGKWVYDIESLVYRYDPERNHFDTLPSALGNFIIGIDIGYEDADAIAVLGFNDTEKTTYLVDECVTAKQGITELVAQINHLRGKYDAHKLVMDFGGLGKKIAEEIIRRYGIPVVAAEKTRKLENIELLNDSMRTRQFRARKDSRFAQDCLLVEWDRDKASPEKRVISERYHSDICDAVLYAWRESYAFANEAVAAKPRMYTPDWFREEAEKMETEAEEYFKRQEEFQKDPLNWG